MLTLGSLFDGAGTFPFAAQQCGVKAVWASEIESFPVEVTKKRFPEMKHLGDITKVDGAEIEPVDIVTFGSPCQDLSVAGKRAGLDGERSGLFIEAVRIIKGPGAVCYITGNNGDIAGTLDASYYKGCGERSGVEREFILCLSKCNVDLRRLTPTECGRLQGMPDWWCEDVPHSDSAEYKMWGNGMALPCVLYVMENVVSVLSLRLLDSLLEVSE